jgi:hypothetical protein
MAGCPLGGAHGRDLGSMAPTHTDPGVARVLSVSILPMTPSSVLPMIGV